MITNQIPELIYYPMDLYIHPISHIHQVKIDFLSMIPEIADNLVLDNEIIYQSLDSFAKYRDKSVLIIGGGPSTNELRWEKLDVDYIWSLNHCFLNPKLRNINLDLITITSETDVSNSLFRDFVIKNNCSIGLGYEFHWGQENVKKPLLELKKKNNVFCFQTRYKSQLGGMPRLMILAHFLGIKNIYYVGFDGVIKIFEGEHAFEAGKSNLPNVAKAIYRQSGDKNNVIELFDMQNKLFYYYFYVVLKSDVKLFNLSEDLDYNMIGKYSKKFNKVPLEIKKVVYEHI